MSGVTYKYGLVIGIFATVVFSILCWIAPSLTLRLLPYAIIFGVTFGLVLFYNITKKKELENDEIIQYHQAFISSFVIAFIGILIFNVSSIVLRGLVFTDIPKMQKELILQDDDAAIEYFKKEIAKNGNKNHGADHLADRINMKKDHEARDFNPIREDAGMSFVSAVSFAGIFGAFFAIITAFFGTRSKPLNTT